MFEGLSDRLSGILSGLTRRGALTEADVAAALREVRRALLEADVALEVVRGFTEKVREQAVGAVVLKSVTPGQMVVKIVNDQLVAMLGTEAEVIDLNAPSPVAILMVGLQGSGKTTTTAKIARRLTGRDKRRVLLASLDTRRPAAMEQLAILGRQVGVETLPIVAGQTAVQIARRAMEAARLGGFDVVMLDTAGRITLDEGLMQEAADVKAATRPHEVLLVADALTGQDAVNTARAFDERLGVTGIVLTRMDGDARGGAALSMRAVTGRPIKLVGTGEKVDALEEFHPARVANRILGMGDIVSLVEKAAETIDQEEALRVAEKMRKGKFDLDDLSMQLAQMEKMGGIGGLMGMLPGMGQIKKQVEGANLDERMFRRQRAIISSMTPAERKNPDILKASRKKRVARGAGVDVAEINKLLKMHRTMADMMKAMGSGKRGIGQALGSMFGLGGGMAGGMGGGMGGLGRMMGGMPQPTPEMLAEMQKALPPGTTLPPMPPGLGGPQAQGAPKGAAQSAAKGAASAPGRLPAPAPAQAPAKGPVLPGLGGGRLPGLPGLGGLPFGKKK
ncbi:Signal recognition particle 54 kDa protein [Methylobacterium crusticola]|uniref:Signal recognition particle protein n=1 Tax=Methylobacterium crusticola TaxID=1697972 RepID=A0ABQ4R0L3_9HYPH|nr:signal recognition particle protein [Methylobacterium crusticola]GJD50846.1 Signal recognition particle 54 kDa protein [Methylobacterium crusticola]